MKLITLTPEELEEAKKHTYNKGTTSKAAFAAFETMKVGNALTQEYETQSGLKNAFNAMRMRVMRFRRAKAKDGVIMNFSVYKKDMTLIVARIQ